jgi:hypothetical protein
LEKAKAFLEAAKREWVSKGGVELAWDREFHHDVLRASEEIADIPGGTLWKAAKVYRRCRSLRELRGGGYEAPCDRRVELTPRDFLAVDGEARRLGTSIGEALGGIVRWWVEVQANKEIVAQIEAERVEAASLREMRLLNDKLLKERKEMEGALKRARRGCENARQRAERHLRKEIDGLKRHFGVNGYRVSIDLCPGILADRELGR